MRTLLLSLILAVASAGTSEAGNYTFSVQGDQLILNGQPIKLLGLRCSNALISDRTSQDLIDQLPTYRAHGINAVSVFLMGSRFGDVKGYRPDATLDPVYSARMGRIIGAADEMGMVVVVGCLYWGDSEAKRELTHWQQEDANRAVANTVTWLKEHNHRNVFVDVDNEGMANQANGWSIEMLIDAGHAVDPSIMIAYNDTADPPTGADLYVHFSPKVPGRPWLDTEATVQANGGYWGKYSKETSQERKATFRNYSRIGRYTEEMKAAQIKRTEEHMDKHNGYMLASTWLQCAPWNGIGGPFAAPGGHSKIEDVDAELDTLHSDAGIAWWLDFTKSTYGPWVPPAAK